MSVDLNVQLGQLPEFWDHSVIYFANLESLFFGNSSKLMELKSEVSGVKTYGGRFVPILNILYKNKENLLLLEKEPCKSLQEYYSKVLGLTIPRMEIFSNDIFISLDKRPVNNNQKSELSDFIDRISAYKGEYVDGYVSDRTLMLWAEKLNRKLLITEDICSLSNNKLELYYYLRDIGLPVMDTVIAETNSDIPDCLNALKKKGYSKAVVKSAIGASGIGMIKIPVEGGGANIPLYFFEDSPCMVQGWMEEGKNDIKSINSPSVQLFIGHDTVYLYDLTEQILTDDSVHQGNISPPRYLESNPGIKEELLTQAKVAGKWLYKNGYKGTASVDFLVVTKSNSVEIYICEINARVTGATYPSVLSRYFLPQGVWIMRNMKTDIPISGDVLIELFDDVSALFSPGRNGGLLPINFNLDKQGKVIKGQFLFLGKNLDYCLNLMDNLRNVLPVEWQYDRD